MSHLNKLTGEESQTAMYKPLDSEPISILLLDGIEFSEIVLSNTTCPFMLNTLKYDSRSASALSIK